jgi:hypothetical protein
MGFNGLLMGCSSIYWRGILEKIYKIAGNANFSWGDIYRNYPEVSKSDLSRLKSSEWIKKSKDVRIIKNPVKKSQSRVTLWHLPNDSVHIARNPKPVKRVIKRKKVSKKN